MERYSKVRHMESSKNIFDSVVNKLVIFTEFLNSWAFSFFLSVKLVCNLNELNPVKEGDKVSWINSMPECTYQDCVKLSLYLHFLSLFLVCIFLGLVNVFIDVSFQSPLDTYVPVINFDFEVGLKIKLSHVIDFNSSEIIWNYLSIWLNFIFRRIVCDSWCPHADHSQAPGSYVLQLDMSDCKDTIQQLVKEIVLTKRFFCYCTQRENWSGSIIGQS